METINEKCKFIVIVNVNLEYTFEVESEEEAIIEAENMELPKEYVSNSFEIVKIIKERWLVIWRWLTLLNFKAISIPYKKIDSITCVLAEILGIFSEPDNIFLELKDKIFQDLKWIPLIINCGLSFLGVISI